MFRLQDASDILVSTEVTLRVHTVAGSRVGRAVWFSEDLQGSSCEEDLPVIL